MSAPYKVYLLNSDAARMSEFSRLIEDCVVSLGLPKTDLEILDCVSANTGTERALAVGIFFGSKEREDSLNQAAQDLVKAGVRVIPVWTPPGHFHTLFPDCLLGTNGFDLEKKLPALVHVTLEGLGLIRKRRRLFISYLRTEGTAVALQVYRILDQRGYDVFLDTQSLLAGDDFQPELVERLADSDLVVFLNSPSVSNSRWVNEERGLAEKFGIRMLIVNWPRLPAPKQFELFEPFPLDEHVPRTERDQQIELTNAELDAVAEKVEALRAHAIGLRTKRISESFIQRAQEDGVAVTFSPVQWLHAPVGSEKLDISIELGVPDGRDFQRVDEREEGEKRKGILYDSAALTGKSREHLKWLREQSKVELLDVKDLSATLEPMQDWLKRATKRDA